MSNEHERLGGGIITPRADFRDTEEYQTDDCLTQGVDGPAPFL